MRFPRKDREAAVRTEKSPRPGIVVPVIKFLVAASLVAYLSVRGHIAWTTLWASLIQWQFSLVAFALLAAMPLVQFWRWQSLLRASQVRLPHREVFSFLMISKFFNMAFPGYVSGDILRGFYVHRRTAKQQGSHSENPGLAAIVSSIVFDRLAGVVPLFVLCLGGLLNSLWTPLPKAVTLWGVLFAGAGIMIPASLFALAYHQTEAPASLIRATRWVRLDRALITLYSGTRQYVRDLPLMRKVLSLSFLNQSLAVASFIFFGKTLGMNISWWSYLVLVPVGLLATAIPISPAGLGVGHLAFLTLFRLVGSSEGANLFTLYMASYVLINLAGAIFYVFPARDLTRPPSPAVAQTLRR